MICLALELSTDRRAVALEVDGHRCVETVHRGSIRTPVLELIRAVLQEAQVDRRDVTALAVGLGPGSYTGVRMALSVAQGWQLGTNVQVCGVDSLVNLACVAGASDRPRVLAVDAQRGEFVVARAAGGRLLEPMRLEPRSEVERLQQEGIEVAGPEIWRTLPGAVELYPCARVAARLAREGSNWVPAESLTPVYLRAANFVKAPPSRIPL